MPWATSREHSSIFGWTPNHAATRLQQSIANAQCDPNACRAEAAVPDVSQLKIKSRVLKLPLAFRESKSKDAMARYQASVRPEATYLPDNVPFVARNNGLEGVEELKNIMFDASYMVFGLGDVYLGAPCAVPVNPLHRCAPHLRRTSSPGAHVAAALLQIGGG